MIYRYDGVSGLFDVVMNLKLDRPQSARLQQPPTLLSPREFLHGTLRSARVRECGAVSRASRSGVVRSTRMETVHALEIDGVCMPHTFVALCALFDKTQDGEYEVNVVEKARLPRFPASFFSTSSRWCAPARVLWVLGARPLTDCVCVTPSTRLLEAARSTAHLADLWAQKTTRFLSRLISCCPTLLPSTFPRGPPLEPPHSQDSFDLLPVGTSRPKMNHKHCSAMVCTVFILSPLLAHTLRPSPSSATLERHLPS